jgi:hypothetical protein
LAVDVLAAVRGGRVDRGEVPRLEVQALPVQRHRALVLVARYVVEADATHMIGFVVVSLSFAKSRIVFFVRHCGSALPVACTWVKVG